MINLELIWQKCWLERGTPSWRWLKFYPFALWRAYNEERLTENAQAMVYVTLLAIVPLLAVAFALLSGFGVKGVIEPWLSDIFSPMGEAGQQVVAHLIRFVSQANTGSLGLIGVIFLLVSVMNLAQKMEDILNQIWHITEARSLTSRITGYISALLLIPITIGALTSVVLNMESAAWLQRWLNIPALGAMIQLVIKLVPLVSVYLLIAACYVWIPNHTVRWSAALVGSAFFLALWYPVSWLFSISIASSSNYSVIYSSFASVVILLLWLYFLWLLFFMGAKVASLIQMPAELAPTRYHQWYADEQLALGIGIIHYLDKAFLAGNPAPTIQTLADTLQTTPRKVRHIMRQLITAQLVSENNEQPPTYQPAQCTENYNYVDVYQSLAMPKDQLATQESGFEQVKAQLIASLNQSVGLNCASEADETTLLTDAHLHQLIQAQASPPADAAKTPQPDSPPSPD